MRARILGLQDNKTIGKNVRIWHHCHIRMSAKVHIEDDCVIKERTSIGGELSIGKGSIILAHTKIDGSGGVKIGRKTHIGRFNTIFSHSHDISQRDVLVLEAPEVHKRVNIGDDVMLFSHVAVMPGVQIGDGAVVGYGSVVTKDLEIYGIYAGVPIKKIGERE